MKQAHVEGVATADSAISAIEKDNRAFGDDDHDDDTGCGEMQVRATLYYYLCFCPPTIATL